MPSLQQPLSTEHSAHESSCVSEFLLVASFLMMSMMEVGCDSKNADVDASAPESEHAARTEVTRGPVRLTVELTPGKPRLSDEPELVVTIRADKGVRVESPPFGGSLGDFIIRDYYEPLPQIVEGAEVLRQVYTLEPLSAGNLSVSPIVVTFTDDRPDGDGMEHMIETDALQIEVTTIVGDDVPTLSDLRPSAAPVELPAVRDPTGWWIIGGVLAVSAIGLAVWRYRRREHTARQLSASEVAMLELDDLMRRDLSTGNVKTFFVELTAVVRRFIERSTGVHAPEQTTEEFLREIADHSTFDSDEKQRLRVFLEAADLVKFAGQTPGQGDINDSLDRAREFIVTERHPASEVVA
jgi:Domain of unknown function (DUF4381)